MESEDTLETSLNFHLPEEYKLGDFILIGKVYNDKDEFVDVMLYTGVLGKDGAVSDIDPINMAGLLKYLNKTLDK